MAKDNRKALPPEPVRRVAPQRGSLVTKSVAKALKKGWRNEIAQGGKRRSLRAYALEADGGTGWLLNKKS